MLAFPSDSNFSLFQIKLTSLHGRVAKMREEIMKKPHGKYPSPILLILSLLYSENIWRNLQENRERGWKESWYSSLSTGVAVARTQVVKHADEAANAYQIFIRPGEAVQLVKEDEIERGRSTSPVFPPFLRLVLSLLLNPIHLFRHIYTFYRWSPEATLSARQL